MQIDADELLENLRKDAKRFGWKVTEIDEDGDSHLTDEEI